MKQTLNNASIPESCLASVSGSVMASELRIGNLVIVENEKYRPKLKDVVLEITEINESMGLDNKNSHGIGLKHINQKPYTYYERYIQLIAFIKPIPITEDWLLKLGATEEMLGHFLLDRFQLIWKESYNYWYVIDRYNACYYSKVEFVHEWQNLYFALNGSDLTLGCLTDR